MTRAASICILSAAAALMLALSLAAAAHGPGSDWLMNGDYRDNYGLHCCSPGLDCLRAEPGEVVRVKGGWLHVPTDTELLDGDAGIHRSESGEMWRCVRGGQMKCLFIAGGV
ncbi:hypothetical protein [Ferrovibrio sp.]|uniref:hypothetical protein n=1 Tax=Ferrovibrio sp. TaxID=1917215 RepID=UPI0035B4312B